VASAESGCRYGLSLSANALYYAEDPENGGGAYAWPFEPPKYGAGASLTVSSLRRPAWRLFGFGAEAAVQGRFVLPDEDYRIDGELSAAFEPVLPLRLSGYAVYDGAGTDLKGYSLEFGAASFGGMKEYASEAPDDMAGSTGEARNSGSSRRKSRATSATCISIACSVRRGGAERRTRRRRCRVRPIPPC
jgi:hypothetical protein